MIWDMVMRSLGYVGWLMKLNWIYFVEVGEYGLSVVDFFFGCNEFKWICLV